MDPVIIEFFSKALMILGGFYAAIAALWLIGEAYLPLRRVAQKVFIITLIMPLLFLGTLLKSFFKALGSIFGIGANVVGAGLSGVSGLFAASGFLLVVLLAGLLGYMLLRNLPWSSFAHAAKVAHEQMSPNEKHSQEVSPQYIINNRPVTNFGVVVPQPAENSPSQKEDGVSSVDRYYEVTPERIQEITYLIDALCKIYEVDPLLVYEVVVAESSFDPNVISSAGAMGLMQLLPSTAEMYDVKNPFDPKQNLSGGIRYLKDLLRDHNGNIALALASYNAGPTTVASKGGIPNYPETKKYVERILKRFYAKKS